MIIDCRIRPPFKSFANLPVFAPDPAPVPPRMAAPGDLPSAAGLNMDLFIAEMDQAGVSHAVAMACRAAALPSQVPDEDVLDLTVEWPDRFIGVGAVHMGCGIDAALQSLDTCVEYGFRGVTLAPALGEPPLMPDNAALYPVYQRCQELDLPVILALSAFHGPDLEYCSPVSLQYVAADFPSLQIVALHACHPWWPHIFSAMRCCPNIWIMPDLYLLDPDAPGSRMCADAVRWLGGDRVLFSSSYPACGLSQAVEALWRCRFGPSVMEKLTHANAEALFGL